MGKNVRSKLGDIAGIAVDETEDILYIFHRAKRSWNIDTDLSKISEPIKENTVLMINATDSSFIYAWGADTFYLPHGISLDRFGEFRIGLSCVCFTNPSCVFHLGNVWLTDVVTHQVYRFKKGYYRSPELILGNLFFLDDFHHFSS